MVSCNDIVTQNKMGPVMKWEQCISKLNQDICLNNCKFGYSKSLNIIAPNSQPLVELEKDKYYRALPKIPTTINNEAIITCYNGHGIENRYEYKKWSNCIATDGYDRCLINCKLGLPYISY